LLPSFQAVQVPGEFVIVNPGVHYFGFSTGYNVSESVNCYTPFWVQHCIHSRPCSCRPTASFSRAVFLNEAPYFPDWVVGVYKPDYDEYGRARKPKKKLPGPTLRELQMLNDSFVDEVKSLVSIPDRIKCLKHEREKQKVKHQKQRVLYDKGTVSFLIVPSSVVIYCVIVCDPRDLRVRV
jgi:hypothetical protein